MTFHIRRYEARDAAAVRSIFIDAVTGIAPSGYSTAQVESWAAEAGSVADTHARCSDGRLVLIAADPADNPVAFTDLEDDGHIDMLFCTPGWAGRGVASALYRELETLARRQNMKHLHVEASEIARPFFARHGFILTRRNDFEIGGVAIHHYTMEKPLLQVRA